MKLCAACHKNLPKDKFSKKQWKLGAQQRRCTSCVADNREAVQPPPNNNDTSCVRNNREVQQLPTANNEPHSNNGIDGLLESISISNDIVPLSDKELFKQPPPLEDCPICFLRMPSLWTGTKVMSCCGQVICAGCIYANIRIGDLCPFCRAPSPDAGDTKDKIIDIKLSLKSDYTPPLTR